MQQAVTDIWAGGSEVAGLGEATETVPYLVPILQ